MEPVKLTAKDYKTSVPIVWCPGCGDFGVLNAMQQAAAELQLPPENLMVVSGIGCSSRIAGYINSYGFNSIHGRALPIAAGAKLARPELTVWVSGGDGDGYSIGTNHFVHTIRRNPDITYIVMDNHIYGLTKGQVSPTTPHGDVTKSTPQGNPERPLNPLALALELGATFIAQGFSGNVKHLRDLIVQATRHKGFALVNVKSPCVTFRGRQEFNVIREHGIYLDESHDPSDWNQAHEVTQWTDKVPLGVIYKIEGVPTLEGVAEEARKKARERRSFESTTELIEVFR
ncbi:2-oxoacid:ferredoxin oxidoreductase subunit beta [Deinococcota bacterium DY0809b]